MDVNHVLRGVQESNAKLHAYFVNPNQRMNPITLGFAGNKRHSDYLYSTISLPFSLFSERMKSLLVGSRQ